MGKKLTQAQELDRATTEDEVMSKLIGCLEALGFRVFHDKAVNLAGGGNPKGFPDICAAHPHSGWVVAIECKRWNGKVSAEQLEWLIAFGAPWADTAPLREHDPTRLTFRVIDTDARRIVGVARPINVDELVDKILENCR